MKTNPTTFGFEVFVTYLLPGMIATLAIVNWHGVTEAQLKTAFSYAKDAEFIVALILLAIMALMGAFISTLQAVLETWLLDRLTPWKLGISRVDFYKHWNKYISDLSKYKNSYVSRVVFFFQFETKLGLAIILFSCSLADYGCTHVVASAVIGFFFYVMGWFHHVELAEFRKDNCA